MPAPCRVVAATSGDAFWPLLSARWFVTILTVLLVLLPLSSQSNLSALRFTSYLGFLSTVLVGVVIVTQYATHTPPDGPPSTAPSSHPFVFSDFSVAWPLLNVAFTAHYNAPVYWRELEDFFVTLAPAPNP